MKTSRSASLLAATLEVARNSADVMPLSRERVRTRRATSGARARSACVWAKPGRVAGQRLVGDVVQLGGEVLPVEEHLGGGLVLRGLKEREGDGDCGNDHDRLQHQPLPPPDDDEIVVQRRPIVHRSGRSSE